MAARGDVRGAKNSRLDVFVGKIFVRVIRHLAVGRKKSSLGAQDDLIARKTLRGECAHRRPHGTLAALKPIVDRRIDHIETAYDGRDDGGCVAFVRGFVWLAKIGTDPDGGENDFRRHVPEMARGGAALKACSVA